MDRPFVVLHFLPDDRTYVCGLDDGTVVLIPQAGMLTKQMENGSGGMKVWQIRESDWRTIDLSVPPVAIDDTAEIVTPQEYVFGHYYMTLGYSPKLRTWIKGGGLSKITSRDDGFDNA